MNKNIGDMTKEELMDFIIGLQEENSRYEMKLELSEQKRLKAIEYIENETNYAAKIGSVTLNLQNDDYYKLLKILKDDSNEKS